MGGAQPLAASFAGASLADDRVPAEPHRLPPAARATSTSRRPSIDDALARMQRYARRGTRGVGRPARQRRRDRARAGAPRAGRRRAARPRHRPDLGARPRQRLPARRLERRAMARRAGRPRAARRAARRRRAELRDARAGDARRSRRWASRPSTTATTSARSRSTRACANAFDFPGFVPAYIRPLFCQGKGPFRWVALSGDPEDIRKTDAKMKELFPDDARPAPLARHGRRAHRVPGPARAHLLDRPRRARPRRPGVQRDGAQSGELKAPIVIGRDHLDSGSVASPNRETESDAGRLRRGVRLAAAQRAAQHRRRRDLGVAAPRRRRRHGLLAARRRRHRLRRHRRRPTSASSACCGTIRPPA